MMIKNRHNRFPSRALWLFLYGPALVAGILVGSPSRAYGQEAPPSAAASAGTRVRFEPFGDGEIENFEKPEMGRPFYAPLTDRAVGLLKAIGADKKTNDGLKKIQKKYAAPSESDWQMRWAAWEFDPETKDVNTGEITHQIQTSTKNLLQGQVTQNLAVWNTFKSGMSFDLSLSSLFGGESPAAAKKRRPAPLRYGLVLRDIEPGYDGVLQASNSPFYAEDLQYAGQAKVSWDIGPLAEEDEAHLFNVHRPEPAKKRAKKDLSAWESFKETLASIHYPKPDFKGKIAPRSTPDVTSDKTPQGLPPAQLTLRQVEDYYRFDYLTKANFKKDAIRHTVSVPIVYQLRIAQEVDESYQPTKTSAKNVLVYPGMAALNLHYLNQEKRYQSDLKYARPGYEVVFTADTPKNWDPDSFGTSKGEKYEIKLRTLF